MKVRAVPRLCELYLGICFTTEEKARKTWKYIVHQVGLITRSSKHKICNIVVTQAPFRTAVNGHFYRLITLPPLSSALHARVYELLDSNPKTWNQNRSVQIETQSLSLSLSLLLMLFCSHWQTGGGVWTPLAHFWTAEGLNILTIEINTWSKDHLEMLTVVHLAPITLRVADADNCLTVFTRLRSWSLSQVIRISTSSQPNNTFKIDFNIIHLTQLLVGEAVSWLIMLASCCREHLDCRQETEDDEDGFGILLWAT
jgi:hypothetical protein